MKYKVREDRVFKHLSKNMPNYESRKEHATKAKIAKLVAGLGGLGERVEDRYYNPDENPAPALGEVSALKLSPLAIVLVIGLVLLILKK